MSTPSAAAAPAEIGYPPAPLAWYAVGVLTAGWILAYLDRQIIVILVEALRADLGMNDTQVSLIQGFAFSLFFVFAGVPIGRLVDRMNRRNILVFGVLAWSLMTIACGLADNFWQLFAARLGVGIGEACLAPASMSLVADLLRPNRRGTAMGLMVSGTGVGTAASIFLGGMILQLVTGPVGLPLLGQTAPWQIVFFAVGTPGLVIALLLLTMKEPERRERADGVDSRAFFRFAAARPAAFGLMFLTYACNFVVGYAVSIWAPVALLRVHGMAPGQVGVIIGSILLFVGFFGASAGGMASDLFARRFGHLGRLAPALLSLPIITVVLFGWLAVDGAGYTIAVFAICGPLLGSVITGSSYPALNQMVPNEMRGQVTAVYLLIAVLAGLGLAPTAVALLTDYVFADPLKLRQSIALVAGPMAALGFLSVLLARDAYVRVAAEREDAGAES